jgi:dienelactone hydrolase
VSAQRWIPSSASLASYWCEPKAGTHPTVVVVPGFGYTDMVTRFGWTQFAQQCASQSIRAVLFDYPSTGNSADDARLSRERLSPKDRALGEGDPDIEVWTQALLDVIRCIGGPVVLVGLRLGATLAAVATRMSEIDEAVSGLVLWAPVVSGRKFRRELTLLASAAPNTSDEAGLSFGGFAYPAALLEQIAALELGTVAPGKQRPLLIVDDARRPIRDDTARELHEVGWDITRKSCPETTAWVDQSSELSEVPERTFAAIVTWMSQQRYLSVSPTTKPMCTNESILLCNGVRETFRLVGPPQLSVVEHVPDVRRSDVAIVMFNSGVERAVGPGRSWVVAARRWAEQGSVVLRVEHSSTGDSGCWPDQARNDVYGEHGVSDIAMMVEHAAALGCHQVVLIGMCSSAYSVLEFGPHPAVKQVLAINPQLYRIGTPPGPIEETTNHAKHRLALIDSKLGLRQKANAVKSMAGLRHRSYEWLQAFAGSPTEVVLLFGETDRGLRFLEREDAREFHRLQNQKANIEVQRFVGLDHALHSVQGRAAVISALDLYVSNAQLARS